MKKSPRLPKPPSLYKSPRNIIQLITEIDIFFPIKFHPKFISRFHLKLDPR